MSDRDNVGSGLYDVYLMDLDPVLRSGRIRRLTNGGDQKGHLTFSWDGKWLLFASEQGGISDETPVAPAAQPYGEMFAYRLADGRMVRLTHNKWEEGIASWRTAIDRPGPPR